ncbi:MAG TPA: mechanosensitive ion channel family protein [Planctomycetota bacterium]|nr:mechanosensitive ion channel family protein [Planctomycetota bacterium]
MKEIWERWLEIIHKPILGNNAGAWGLALLVGVVTFIAVRVVVRSLGGRLAARAEKQGSKILGFLGEVVGRTSFFTLLLAAAVAATQFVVLPGQIAALLRSLLVVAALLQGGLWATLLLEKWLEWRMSTSKESSRSTAVTLLTFSGKLLLWSFIALMSLENLGIDVTALIAGLGVGGIAVALATQTLLGDLLGSVVIAIDKPFEVGDLIIVGDLSGTVETIGLKTTRVRSIYGEQIVFSNMDLLGSRIRNYKRMSERRVVFTFDVSEFTPVEKLDVLPGVIKEEVGALPDLRFERAYFQRFNGVVQVWEVVFHVMSADIGLHMDRQHQVNLALHKRFLREGIAVGAGRKAA